MVDIKSKIIFYQLREEKPFLSNLDLICRAFFREPTSDMSPSLKFEGGHLSDIEFEELIKIISSLGVLREQVNRAGSQNRRSMGRTGCRIPKPGRKSNTVAIAIFVPIAKNDWRETQYHLSVLTRIKYL